MTEARTTYRQDLAWIGINPATQRVDLIGEDSDETLSEIRKAQFIAVPVRHDLARRLWGLVVPDIYHPEEAAS